MHIVIDVNPCMLSEMHLRVVGRTLNCVLLPVLIKDIQVNFARRLSEL